MDFPDLVSSLMYWLAPGAALLAEWGRFLTQLLPSERCYPQIYSVLPDSPSVIHQRFSQKGCCGANMVAPLLPCESTALNVLLGNPAFIGHPCS